MKSYSSLLNTLSQLKFASVFRAAQVALLLWVTLLPTQVSAASSVDGVRVYRAPDHTRVVFDVSGSVKYSMFELQSPRRLVIDLVDTKVIADLSKVVVENSPVVGLRSGSRGTKDLRVVLDLAAKVRPVSFVLPPNQNYGSRLVVDLFDVVSPSKKKAEVKAAKKAAKIEKKKRSRSMIVAIDAGHGGEDPGASGSRGTREKHVALQIAKRVQSHLNKEPGVKAYLVRKGDYYIGLKERSKIARQKYKADVFVSIHADAFTNPAARGASVFALSRRGATTAAAKYLAKIENQSDLIGGVIADEQASDVLTVLADMTMEGTLEHSLYVGKFVLEELKLVTKLHGNRNRVEQAGFAVLKEPEMVSILVETGYISNKKEEALLRSKHHQAKIANAVVNGLVQYFVQYPAPNTYFADLRDSEKDYVTYKVRSGDTLSAIAQRYRVTSKMIRRANKLKNDNIRVGQVLRIPQK